MKSNLALFRKINIVGLGLIGGSIAKACRFYNVCNLISGFDIEPKAMNFAIGNKIIDEIYNFNSENLDNDLTIICSKISTYKDIFNKISSKINNSIIIDVGSVKSCVIDWADKFFGQKSSNFIACHPIAGSDKSGIYHSCHDLFCTKNIIISPTNYNQQKDIKKVTLFWNKLGSEVELMEANYHDKIFALVSHLPQFLAFVASDNCKINNIILQRHFRLQNSNPNMWKEVFLLNLIKIKKYISSLLIIIDSFIGDLKEGKENFKILSTAFCLAEKMQGCPIGDFSLKKSTTNQRLIINRTILVACFLNLPDIAEFYLKSGNGFKDFTAPSVYLKSILENLNLIQTEKLSIIKFLRKIQLKIMNYEFN